MATKADLVFTNNMANNKKPLLTDLVTAFTSIQTYTNTEKSDQLQITNDGWGTGYGYNGNGTQNFATSTLYNKITSKAKYTGGNIVIAAVGAWTDVDAANTIIQMTPEYLTGHFKATFQFNLMSLTSNAVNETEVRFRLNDGVLPSDAIANIRWVTGVNATRDVVPVTLEYQFSNWNVALHTVGLQYFIVTSTATVITVLANTNSPVAMQVEKI